MKLHLLTAIFTSMLLSAPSGAQTPEQAQLQKVSAAEPNVTVRVSIIAMPNAEAMQFSAKEDLSGKPSDALNKLEELVAQKAATSVANPAITTKDSHRALSESGKITLEVEPLVSQDRKTVGVNLLLNDSGHKITTTFEVSNGGTKFLGSVQNPTDTAMTDYIFVRVSY